MGLWVLYAGCTKHDPAAGSLPILRVSQRNEPATLDPQLATLPDEYFTARALFEGLVTPNPDGGAPLPGVAERWEPSADGLTWTFYLRANARWSNGDLVTAQDFVWSYRRILTPSLGAAKAPLFFPVKNALAYQRGAVTDFAEVGFSARDTHTLVIALEQPAPFLPALAATGAWLPLHPPTLEHHGAGRSSPWSEAGNLVGNGPYVLSSWRRSQFIELRKNPAYWDRGVIHVPVVRLVLFDNGDAEERAFRAGQIDVTMAVPSARLDHYRQNEPGLLRQQPLSEVRCLSLNLQRTPLDDVRVREALSLAIDREALTKNVLKGGQEPTALILRPSAVSSLPSPGLPVAGESAVARARRLLAEAGFPEGRHFPRLEFSTWTNSPVLEAIQEMWRRNLGIETSILQREGRAHLAALAAGDFDLSLVPIIPDYDHPVDILGELTGASPSNYGRWSNTEYDRLVLAAGRYAEPDPDGTRFRAAMKILQAEQPVIPLYFSTQSFLISPRVKGWRSDPYWTRYYRHVRLAEE